MPGTLEWIGGRQDGAEAELLSHSLLTNHGELEMRKAPEGGAVGTDYFEVILLAIFQLQPLYYHTNSFTTEGKAILCTVTRVGPSYLRICVTSNIWSTRKG